MTLNAEELEQPYFIPTSENVSQILLELGTAEERHHLSATIQQLLRVKPAVDRSLAELKTFTIPHSHDTHNSTRRRLPLR